MCINPENCSVNVFDEFVELLALKDELRLTFPESETQSIASPLPILNLYLEHILRFFSIQIIVQAKVNNKFEDKLLHFTNHSTTVRILPNEAVVPIVPIEGWNRLCIDLAHTTQRLWTDAKFDSVVSVTVTANCRLKRIFLSDRQRKNEELPPSLHR